MSSCVLAIDIGASSGRHIVGWLEGGKLATREVYRFPNGAAMKNGHLCWDIESLEGHVVAGLNAVRQAGYTPVSIGIDTWGVDFILLDEHGQRVGDAVAYRDQRTNGMDQRLERHLPPDEHYRIAGIAKQPFNTVYQMMAVLDEHPEYRHQVADFLFMPEYLSYVLTGRKAHEWTECTTGALCDAARHTWSDTILRAAELPEAWFRTPIVEPGTMLGRLKPDIAAEVGFDATVILPATHDTGSAYMAVPAMDDRAAFLSSGTWSLLGMELQQPILTRSAREIGFTNEGGYAGTTRFLKNIMGMWMLQCIHREIGESISFAEMARMAAASDYPAYVDAADQRFLAPASMLDEVKAALRESGAPDPRQLGDTLRAVTVGLAVCYRDAIQEMSRVVGKPFTSVNIVGGGSQNQVLNQLTADMTGLPVYAGPTEGTALGNLAAQLIQLGEIRDIAAFRAMLFDGFRIEAYRPSPGDGRG